MDQDPLQEWSRLTNENTLHSVVSTAYVGMLSRSPQIDKFSTWLLAGTGATASLLIANIQFVSKALTVSGFQVCLSLLAISALFGLFAKSATVFFPVDGNSQSELQDKMAIIFTEHGKVRDQIEESAEKRNLPVPPDVEISEIVTELLKPTPFYWRWAVLLYLKKHQENRQIGFLLPLRAFMWQVNFCFIQAFLFVAFIVATILHIQSV